MTYRKRLVNIDLMKFFFDFGLESTVQICCRQWKRRRLTLPTNVKKPLPSAGRSRIHFTCVIKWCNISPVACAVHQQSANTIWSYTWLDNECEWEGNVITAFYLQTLTVRWALSSSWQNVCNLSTREFFPRLFFALTTYRDTLPPTHTSSAGKENSCGKCSFEWAPFVLIADKVRKRHFPHKDQTCA